ncbi:hypothetical protein HPP92_002355 [Vanilla planifolia]|uniref:AB hydrolase-1 domain-containing protein n=1 Tax=Vanilla planifolia TaxID=51239 RepID=A0A835VEF9_VANPL|nr:hypothetical protein HPP92_002355 [Vanilla planifolia]
MALASALIVSPSPAKLTPSSISVSRRFSGRLWVNPISVRCVSSRADSIKATAVAEKPSTSSKGIRTTLIILAYDVKSFNQCDDDGLGYEGCVQTTKEEYNLGAIFSIMWKKVRQYKWLYKVEVDNSKSYKEWRAVAKDIVTRKGNVSWRATIVDWPGLGYSDRPLLNYNAQVMESFLIELMNAKDSPLSSSATIALHSASNGWIRASAIVAVAPTWCGPLPIVFGRTSEMESRYGLLRGTLRAPAVGWMMYNVLVSNEKSIESQYKSHVYADPNNVTPSIIKSRYALTKRKGSRYVPAAFLTGLLDPVKTREEFLDLFAKLDGVIPILVVSTKNAPKRSKAEIDALVGAKGVTKFVEVAGALLPQEEYPLVVAEELYQFLQSLQV